jgi:Synergist-CTERM protein sorting domain-containing protein
MATIINGIAPGKNYMHDFTIEVIENTDFVPVTDISDIPETATAGIPLVLTGTVVPSNATNMSITWSVVDNGETGEIITGGKTLNTMSEGTATVKATIINGNAVGEDLILYFNIKVNPGTDYTAVDGIIGVETTAIAGIPLTLNGTVEPSDATNKNILWSVYKDGGTGAIITGDNTLNTMATGTVTVSATIINGSEVGTVHTEYFNITVIDGITFIAVSNISITGFPMTVTAGKPLPLSGNVEPTNATNRSIIWSVQNTGGTGATMTGSTFNATAAGTATVRAKITNGSTRTKDFTHDFHVMVSGVAGFIGVTGISGVPTLAKAGHPLTLSGNVEPQNATNRTIIWSVQNTGGTGATITGSTLNTTAAGIATVRAKITNGWTETKDFTYDLHIAVKESGTIYPLAPENPSDKKEVSAMTGIDPDDLEVIGNKVYLSRQLTEKYAKELHGTDDVYTHILPIFKVSATPDGQIGAVTFTVKGSELLALFTDEVNLIGMTSKNTGEFLNYTSSTAGEDGEFTILFEGEVFDGEIISDNDYELLVFMRDGGMFDLDGEVNGELKASIFFSSEITDDEKRREGCNAGYGILALALIPLVTRKRQ